MTSPDKVTPKPVREICGVCDGDGFTAESVECPQCLGEGLRPLDPHAPALALYVQIKVADRRTAPVHYAIKIGESAYRTRCGLFFPASAVEEIGILADCRKCVRA